MTRQVKTLIIAGAAVVLLGVALFLALRFVENGEESSSSSTPSTTVSLYQRELSEIKTITIQNEKGETLLQNQGGEDNPYTVPALAGLPLKDTTISALFRTCANLTASETVAENPEDLSLYGLDTPRASLTIGVSEGEGLTIELGNTAPGGTGTYIQTDRDETVYLMSSTQMAPALLGTLEFVDTNITSIDANFMLSVETLYLGGTARPEPVKGEYRESLMYGSVTADGETPMAFKITEPHERNYDTSEGQDILMTAFGMTAQEVVAVHPTEEELAAYGLAEPYTVLELGYNEGQTLRLISSQPQDGSCYVMKDDLPIVYRVKSDGLRWVEAQYPDFVMSLLLLAYINDVSSVDVVSPEQSYTFTINGADDDMTAFYGDQELDLKNFKLFYQVLIGIPTDEYVAQPPEVNPEDALVTITFHYDDTSRPSESLAFFEGPPRQVYMALNGEIEFLTKSTYAEKVLEDCERVIRGETVTTIF